VRLAGPADAAAIASVKAAGWRDTYASWVRPAVLAPFLTEAAVARGTAALLQAPENFIVVAENDTGTLIGFATCLTAGRPEPFLEALHVRAGTRGTGVGTALLHQVATELRHRRHDSLTVTLVTQNVRARQLYERLGATYVTTFPAPWAPDDVTEAHYRWPTLRDLEARSRPNS
jgi:GNAT superfamily N-acetyltransferase